MTYPISAIIVDDEQEARDLLESLLKKFPEVEVLEKLSNVDEAVVSFVKNKPMLVFLDVQMPQKDGFEFIHAIKEYDIKTCIVFITAYHQFAIEAIKHTAFDYLLKPVNQSDLQKTIERFRLKCKETDIKKNIDELLYHMNNHKKIKLCTRNGFELINPESILYLEADGNYSHICYTAGNKTTSTQNLGSLESNLPKEYFFRIGRAFIINTMHLSSVDRKHKTCKMQGHGKEYELPIAKDRMRELEEFL
jgi:two-component system, LytTR family, response regulator